MVIVNAKYCCTDNIDRSDWPLNCRLWPSSANPFDRDRGPYDPQPDCRAVI
jgi:hypothetical protein